MFTKYLQYCSLEKIKVNESLKSSIHVICSYLYVCSLKQNYLQYLVVHSKETLISKSLIAFLYNVLELPVQMSWDNNEEINKEGLYQQALGFDIQHSQTHRPSRTRGIHSQLLSTNLKPDSFFVNNIFSKKHCI